MARLVRNKTTLTLILEQPSYMSVRININWNYKNADVDSLNNLIENYQWDNIINDITVDKAFKKFTDIFLGVL